MIETRCGRVLGSMIVAGVVMACLGGCIPSRIMIDLAPGDGELTESPVLTDPGASIRAPKVAQIDIDGIISQTTSPGLVIGRSNAVDSLVTRLRKAEADPSVRAVVLRINSPGGTVAASETMYEEIRKFRERSGKPVVVSMGEIATSGGYYIALAGDHIMAQPTTVTGSIGVLVQTFNLSRGMDRIGISGRAVVSRENKAIANPFEAPEEEHYAILQHLTDQFYKRFRGLVVERRPMLGVSETSIDVITDGRVFTGAEAARLGVIDDTGTLHDAFERAKSLANIGDAQLVKYHAEGTTARSPYATAFDLPPSRTVRGRDGAGIEVSVSPLRMEARLPGGEASESGFYYLWIAPSP